MSDQTWRISNHDSARVLLLPTAKHELNLDFDRTASITDVAANILAHSALGLLRQRHEYLTGRSPASLDVIEILFKRCRAEAVLCCNDVHVAKACGSN